MMWRSVRARLTFWNVAVLALVLVGFGTLVCYTVRVQLANAVDKDLSEAVGGAARWIAHAEPPPGPPGPNILWLGPGPGHGFGMGPGPERRRFQPPRPRNGNRRGGPEGRPAFFKPDGKPLMPFGSEKPWDIPALRVVAKTGHERFTTLKVDGEPHRVLSLPVYKEGKLLCIVQGGYAIGEQLRLNDRLLRVLITLVPVALLVAGLGGLFLAGRAIRPIRGITRAAAQLSAEDLSRRLPVEGRDEIAELATTFNSMAARLDKAFRELEDAFEQQRRFTADASHELRTPLTRVKATTSLMLSAPRSAEEYRKALGVVDQAAEVMSRLIQDLLLLARSDAGQLVIVPQPTEVGDSIRWAVAQAEPSGDPSVRVDLPREPLMAMAREEHLRRVLLNLLQNALRHTPPGGEVAVTGRTEGDRVVVQVRDTGEGIAPDHLPHVFERFYRADAGRARAQGGTGLGLAICQSLLTAVGGTLSLDSELGVGTTATVTLPAAELQLEDETSEEEEDIAPEPNAEAPQESGAAVREGGELPLGRK